jgi:hypothetical protein
LIFNNDVGGDSVFASTMTRHSSKPPISGISTDELAHGYRLPGDMTAVW